MTNSNRMEGLKMATITARYYYEGEEAYDTFDVDWVVGVTGRSPDSLVAGNGFDINGTYYTIV